jgi:hypothetical protein
MVDRTSILIDDEDRHFLDEYTWWIHKTKTRNYLRAHIRGTGRGNGNKVYLHRLIMQAGPGQEVDHIDGNSLNNHRSNLRFVTRSQNNANGKSKGSKSGFKGVHWDGYNKTWIAKIEKDYTSIVIGRYNTKEDAGPAYEGGHELVAIILDEKMLPLVRNKMGKDGKVRLQMPRELLVDICKEADGWYF